MPVFDELCDLVSVFVIADVLLTRGENDWVTEAVVVLETDAEPVIVGEVVELFDIRAEKLCEPERYAERDFTGVKVKEGDWLEEPVRVI